MKKFVLLLMVLPAIGSIHAESKKEKAEREWRESLPDPNAEYGTYPESYEAIVTNYYADRLKDPESAKYSDWRAPKKSYRVTDIKNRIAEHGYSVCVKINAKNSYGAYTGKKLAWLFIRDNTVIQSGMEDSTDWREQIPFLGAMKRGDCAEINEEPTNASASNPR